ncbi:MAG: response regulator, partial [Planctomycetes bacterium]|nr:response regulator [Planctomycetota bacterium]
MDGRGAPLKVLVVDDDPDASFTLQALLELAPSAPATETAQATTFEEGLARTVAGGFDVLVFDHRLGRRTGLELIGECRAQGVTTPIVVLTGRGDEQVAVQAMKAGAIDYLVKHRLTPEHLVAALRHAAERGERERLARQVEDAQRTSEEHLRLVAQTSNDTTWVFDLTTGAIRLSESFRRQFGHDALELRDGRGWWEEHLHPDDRARCAASLRALMEGRASTWSEEYRLRRADGSWAHVLDRAYLVRDAAGRPVRAVGTLMDQTSRVRREEELRQAQKMEAIGRLAGGVAHDFNNLLTAIIGYSELLADQVPPGPQRRAVEQIRQAGQRAAALTHQLLAFSRKQVLQPEVLDPGRVVADLQDMLRRLISEDIEVVTDLAPDVGRLRADRAQLEQVIVNLAVNARDAMPRGGRLTISTRQAPGDPPRVVLTVSDTGEGMSPEVLAHIFEPFFTTKEVGRGTGLGLSMVYGIVKQSGGDVQVRSAPGAGTTFELAFPAAADDPAPAGQRKPTAPVPGGRETVLVVEDEDAVRQLVREVLSGRGYHVLEAARGEQAIDLAAGRDGPIDLVLSDVVMPGINGRDLVERLTALRPGLRVLFMSGHSGDLLARAEVEPWATVLEKPFTPDHLSGAVGAPRGPGGAPPPPGGARGGPGGPR